MTAPPAVAGAGMLDKWGVRCFMGIWRNQLTLGAGSGVGADSGVRVYVLRGCDRGGN